MATRKKITKKKSTPKKSVAKKPAVKKTPAKKAAAKKVLKIRRSPAKAVKTVIKSPFKKEKKGKMFIRYSFDIVSFVTNKSNIVEQIFFTYKGTLVIPQEFKDKIKPSNHIVEGSLAIPKDIDHPLNKLDYRSLEKKQTIVWLTQLLRDGYIDGMKEVIHEVVWPETKNNTEVPWK